MQVHDEGLRLTWAQHTAGIDLAPLDGLWTETQYLKISEQTNHLLEYVDGSIEVVPMPTRKHQIILLFLYELLVAAIRPHNGIVLIAPMRLRMRQRKFREPDILVLLDRSDPRNEDAYWLGADLVVEIVSKDDPERDTVVKRRDYAEAGIPEYWIVNPLDETITVLTLDGEHYLDHGIFRRGEQTQSVLIPSWSVGVADVFDAA